MRLMNIGIIIFAYNRSIHLEHVLNGLRKNDGISKLYIFQDGLKCEQHQNGWESTRHIIMNIDWCEVVYRLSSYNKGLAKSIVDGVNAVFKENDAVIVLEDDCVPTANFISFMKKCFEKYQNNEKVYSISGYAWPIDLPKNEYDVYGCGRVSSWGWGTWKDRWQKYSQDYEIIKRINSNKDLSANLALWGRDLESMLINRQKGMNDSWAVFWALTIIEAEGICISPYKSLIRNIGMDGSGVHCGITHKFDVELYEDSYDTFCLPEKIVIENASKYAFAPLYGSYTVCADEKAGENTPAIVCGAGNCFFRHEKSICEEYNIIAFMDRNKKGWFAGREVIGYQDVNRSTYARAKILIMIQDIFERQKVINLLIKNGMVTEDRIILCDD